MKLKYLLAIIPFSIYGIINTHKHDDLHLTSYQFNVFDCPMPRNPLGCVIMKEYSQSFGNQEECEGFKQFFMSVAPLDPKFRDGPALNVMLQCLHTEEI